MTRDPQPMILSEETHAHTHTHTHAHDDKSKEKKEQAGALRPCGLLHKLKKPVPRQMIPRLFTYMKGCSTNDLVLVLLPFSHLRPRPLPQELVQTS